IATMAVSPGLAFGFSFVVAIAGAMLVGTLVGTRRHVVFMVLVPLSLGIFIIALSPAVPALMRLGGAAFVLLLWLRSISAIRNGNSARFAYSMNMALALSIGLVMAGRLALRVNRDANAAERASLPSYSNPEWLIAQDLRAHGVDPGTRIAV